jgi:hypothetical protein
MWAVSKALSRVGCPSRRFENHAVLVIDQGTVSP